MHPRHRRHYAQTKPVARRATAFFRAIEAPEYKVAFIRGNSRPVVRNRQNGAVVPAISADPHKASVASMFDCVVHQIRDRIKEEVPVAENFNRFAPLDLQTAASLLRGGVEEFSHLLRYERKIESAKRAGLSRRFDLRNACQRAEHAKHVVKIHDGAREKRLIVLRLAIFQARAFDPGAHAG